LQTSDLTLNELHLVREVYLYTWLVVVRRGRRPSFEALSAFWRQHAYCWTQRV